MQKAVLFVNGVLRESKPILDQLLPEDYLVAVDGGLMHMERLGLIPDLIIGDMDSIPAGYLSQMDKQIDIKTFPPEKDETDLELALELVLRKGYKRVLIAAGLGGRLDHTLGNLFLLTSEKWEETEIRIDDGVDEVFIIRSQAEIQGKAGDVISLIPLGKSVEGVLTSKLAYPLRHETLYLDRTRGISNVMEVDTAKVQVESGTLLCIHSRQSETAP